MQNMDVEAPLNQAPKKKPTFKIIGHFVLAMKRFQNALNPTYDYGAAKAKDQGHAPKLGAGRAGSGRVGSGRTGSGRTSSGRLETGGVHHGYKGNLLFKPLPKSPDEEVQA